MTYWQMILNGIGRQLWWKTILYGLIGVAAALVGVVTDRFLYLDLPLEISASAVSSLLGIISSSMLSVTTFSIGAMTTAFGSASSGVTPRATMLLQQDGVTHSVISSFIGAFIFSVVGSIALTTGSYGPGGRVVLFVLTIIVVGIIVVQILRWVNHLMSFGRSSTTTQQVEDIATEELKARISTPYLGANPWKDTSSPPPGAKPLMKEEIGYLRFVNMNDLSCLSDEAGLEIYLPCNPGAFLYKNKPVAWIVGDPDEETLDKIQKCFLVSETRNFEQDPRFGIIVMAEIGSRALSSAVNDVGTAIEIIGRLTRLLAIWGSETADEPVQYPRLYLNPLNVDDLFDDAFLIIGRDGAALVEIQIRLQKSLWSLSEMGSESFRQSARSHAKLMMQRAEGSNMLPEDLNYLRRTIEDLTGKS